ncbi:hypothetical protein G9A89_021649 [Geosiphon pyriformis]|nr:hypothetical protein G9A89_021649 [Geosiphon pyriformis]
MSLLFTQNLKDTTYNIWCSLQQLGLNSNHYLAESAFNYYVNDKITDCLGETINIDLPRNHSFVPIIRKINQTIEKYTQQQFLIIYADKDKGKIQTPAVTPKGIQLPSWKKHRVELPTVPSYHYTLGSAINISSANAFTLNITSIFGRFQFQNNQWKEDLLGPYKLSEEEKKGSKDQGFTYQNPISENLKFGTPNVQTSQNLNIKNLEIETLNIRTQQNQNNQNPDLINHQTHSAATLTTESTNPSATKTILATTTTATTTATAATTTTKCKPNGLCIYCKINDVSKAIIANNWDDARYQSLATRPQTFQQFKTAFLRYFSNNNSINCLANTFTTIKQNNTEVITTYLECFYRVLRQIQAINAVYFTELQILNQFICGLCTAVTHARDFESAKLEANYAQAVNLVMNRLSDLDSKLKQISDTINQKIKGYLANNHQYIYQPPQKCSNQENANHFQNQACPSLSINQPWQQEMCVCHNYGKQESISKLRSIPKHLSANNAAANLSSTSISDSSLSTAATSNISTAAIHNILTTVTSNLSTSNHSNTTPKLTSTQNPKTENNTTKLEIELHSQNSGINVTQNPNFQNYLSFLVIPEDATTNNSGSNQQQALTNNIPPATVTNNESLMAIFPFDLEEMIKILLFNRAALKEKPITAMYMDVKINGHIIKLILDSGSAGSIITKQLMDQLGEIDNLPIKINDITVSIKVLVMEAIQYQALVRNNWLSKTNAILDWTMQKLQLSQNGQHTRAPAVCDHFKPTNLQPLIEFEEETIKPIWEVYQISWTDVDHNELLSILA